MIRVTRSPVRQRAASANLDAAKLGQSRIDDTGIAPCRAEMQVELALAMAQQDHGSAIQAGPQAGNPPVVRELFVSGALRHYL